MRMTFARWLALLALHADFLDYPVSPDLEAWWDMYMLGLTPAEALIEDIAHADWEGVEPAPKDVTPWPTT